MPAASTPLRRRTAAALLVISASLALTACVDAGDGDETAQPTPSATSTPTATSEPTPAPTSDPDPIGIACGDLVDPQAVYDFDPNYALLDDWTPDAGTDSADAIAAGGVACHWMRESGGVSIDVSVARLSEDAIREKKNAAYASSQMVPTYGEEAYFEVEGGVGTAIVFQGSYWLVISSAAFAEPGEPTGIIDSALAAL